MHYGFRIVEHLKSGLEGWMSEKGYATLGELVGRSVPRIKSWGELDLNYKVIARIDQQKCIHCGLCYIACEDGCHQSIRWDRVSSAEFLKEPASFSRNGVTRSGGHEVIPGAGGGEINVFTVKEDICVGCNMCSLVCPVEGCITMHEVDTGRPPMSWNEYQAKLARGEVTPIQPPPHA
jgi:dihydropyrimidine dehydrogenase (NAD+) subunit PreA